MEFGGKGGNMLAFMHNNRWPKYSRNNYSQQHDPTKTIKATALPDSRQCV